MNLYYRLFIDHRVVAFLTACKKEDRKLLIRATKSIAENPFMEPTCWTKDVSERPLAIFLIASRFSVTCQIDHAVCEVKVLEVIAEY